VQVRRPKDSVLSIDNSQTEAVSSMRGDVTNLNFNSTHIGPWRQVLGVKSSVCLSAFSKKEAVAP
jgi:hypothetical protein